MKAATILIVDDEVNFRKLLKRVLELEGFEIIEAEDGKSALFLLEKHGAEVVICDVRLPELNGIDLLSKIKNKYPFIEIIMLTAFGKISDGVKAIKNGAFDYIIKGDDNEKLIPLLHRAIEKVQLQKRVLQLEKLAGENYSFENIAGKSKEILAAVEVAKKVAITDTPVLLLGETGTGKEVFAHSIHRASDRKFKSFVAVNCSSFSKELLENELFGHKAGSFTGATKDSKGLFEEAHLGTIFLDEIAEISTDVQAKLLRVLETGEFLKLGDSKTRKVDVRIIAATNKDLQKEISSGNFRADLFYRLGVFQITLPPLRNRPEDIEILARVFLNQLSFKIKKVSMEMSSGFLDELKKQEWKGNIRELKNTIERSVILTDGKTLLPESLPFSFFQHVNKDSISDMSLDSMEKNHIRNILHHTQGNKTKAAEILGIGLTTLYRRMQEFGIDK